VDQLERVSRAGQPPRWRDPDGNLYEYDGRHVELEVFNRRGSHIGVADVFTGEIIKPPRRGRKIDV
jgi:hypothetical protein